MRVWVTGLPVGFSHLLVVAAELFSLLLPGAARLTQPARTVWLDYERADGALILGPAMLISQPGRAGDVAYHKH
jgi:hypothetical protein